MKILHVTNIPSPYRVDYFNELGKRAELTVLFECESFSHRDSSWKNYKFDNFDGIICKRKVILKNISLSLEQVKYLKKTKSDWIIIGNAFSLTGLFEILYLKRKKIAYWIEGDGAFAPDKESRIKFRLKRFLLKGAKGYLSTCDNHDKYYAHYGISEDKVYRYPFTSLFEKDIVEKPCATEEKLRLRKELGMPEEHIVITVGQFIHRKGFDVLTEAIPKTRCEIGYYFIGGDGLKQIDGLKNAHAVPFQSKDILKKYYDAADVFVLPTRYDIWGLVINEAMARGLPVLTTDRCNAGVELVENGVNGYLVPVDNADELAEKLMKMVYNDKLDEMAKASLRRIHGYTIEEMVNAHIEIYHKYGEML